MAEAATKRTSLGTRGSLRGSCSGRVVVVAEDEGAIRSVINEVLRGEGYTVVSVASAAHLARAVEEFDACAVIADLNLGELTAEDVIAELVDAGRGPSVIIVSASPSAATIAAREGVRLLPKPFDLDDLLQMVRASYEKTSQSRSLSAATLEPHV